MAIRASSTSALEHVNFEKRYDANGSVWIWAKAHAALTADTPYKVIVNELGYVTAALADDTLRYFVGVPNAAVASGDWAWIQIGGRVTAMVTVSLSVAVGHALEMLNGAVADEGSDYNGDANEFAVQITASTSATTQDCLLIPEMITAAT